MKGHYIHCKHWTRGDCTCRWIRFRYWLSDKLASWSRKVGDQ